ncbi:MAG TPA: hypothetical protein VG734_21130 [Lacunisphaera sp.]|nr:hypothetical protein [Lacunisphaera sp.]
MACLLVVRTSALPVDGAPDPLVDWLENPERWNPARALVLVEVVRVEREEFSLSHAPNSAMSFDEGRTWTSLLKVRTGVVAVTVIESPWAALPQTLSVPFKAQHYVRREDEPWHGTMIKPGQRLLGFFRQDAKGQWVSESPFFRDVVSCLLEPKLASLLAVTFTGKLADPELVRKRQQEYDAADARLTAN